MTLRTYRRSGRSTTGRSSRCLHRAGHHRSSSGARRPPRYGPVPTIERTMEKRTNESRGGRRRRRRRPHNKPRAVDSKPRAGRTWRWRPSRAAEASGAGPSAARRSRPRLRSPCRRKVTNRCVTGGIKSAPSTSHRTRPPTKSTPTRTPTVMTRRTYTQMGLTLIRGGTRRLLGSGSTTDCVREPPRRINFRKTTTTKYRRFRRSPRRSRRSHRSWSTATHTAYPVLTYRGGYL
mmetsp:Transcript_10827/g.30254  ORF Transcript_10827/g.30254 Transcript_10827/m.30254 type:complete len:234 (-) Transcript_10827:346-1047(-)